MANSFPEFVAKFGLVEMAAATSLGVAVNHYVRNLVSSIVMPFLSRSPALPFQWHKFYEGTITFAIIFLLVLSVSYLLISSYLSDYVKQKKQEQFGPRRRPPSEHRRYR